MNTCNDWRMYHIYPMGFCQAPTKNDFSSAPQPRLDQIKDWIPHLKSLEINALYLGPIFESTSHGYDTQDYYAVDRRLGTIQSVKSLIEHLHQEGIKVILDGVFNHVGRDFWAFRDLLWHQEKSWYKDWFAHVNFHHRSPYKDRFSYEGWNGHYNLVKLNLQNPDVVHHLLDAVKMWITELQIDGLRLDACDVVDMNFLSQLSAFTKKIKPDFWLMGEIIHGDYRRWVNESMLDSVTNYECYKGLWSSMNDTNLFEIEYALTRQFGENGLYKHCSLYNFTDNHDVSRVASSLKNPFHLHPLYLLLFTMPGIPSIYYGSEWGIEGKKISGTDHPLRPYINREQMEKGNFGKNVKETIIRLSKIRKTLKALKGGDYKTLHISLSQLAFRRTYEDQQVIVLLNIEEKSKEISLNIPISGYDLLNHEEMSVTAKDTILLYPNWGRIIKVH